MLLLLLMASWFSRTAFERSCIRTASGLTLTPAPNQTALPRVAHDFCYTAAKIKFKYKVALVANSFARQIYFVHSIFSVRCSFFVNNANICVT